MTETVAVGHGIVARAPLAGGAVVTLASGETNPICTTLDATNVYWGQYGVMGSSNGGVMSVASGADGDDVGGAAGQRDSDRSRRHERVLGGKRTGQRGAFAAEVTAAILPWRIRVLIVGETRGPS
jgi:hypothetical protein